MGSGEKSLPRKIRYYVFLSHALSTWGDRMWSFGVGLFMVIISPEDLRVTAVYGLTMGVAILLFGALVGDWIDRTPRLKAARTTLVVQNLSVILCAGIVFVVVTLKADIEKVWPNQGLLRLSYGIIIAVAIVSTLGSMGTTIAVQRDWIVEICGRDKELLASMSATLRRIDLITKILAPIATGQIMTYGSVGVGALFIAGWNLVSVFVEYILLWKVYIMVPALRSKKNKKNQESVEDPENEEEMIDMATTKSDGLDIDIEVKVSTDAEPAHDDEEKAALTPETQQNEDAGSDPDFSTPAMRDEHDLDKDAGEDKPLSTEASGNMKEDTTCCGRYVRKMFSGILILGRGWKTYMKYDVASAGLGLAALYMTVLGFDNITVGYAYTQGVNESIMGILMAAGAITGILGTILYPVIRRHIGLERTGLFGYLFEVMFLCLCVASIWAPGSPFDPLNQKQDTSIQVQGKDSNLTSLPGNNSSIKQAGEVTPGTNVTLAGIDTLTADNISNMVDLQSNAAPGGSVSTETSHSFVSVALLMAGIIGARCGLWMADLTITQLFLENIKEKERGIVNGVQTSLNKLMDMLKFVMVIAAPQPNVFGILILISFIFICIGWMLYARYSYKVRGHLFHFDKLKKCECVDARNNNRSTPEQETAVEV